MKKNCLTILLATTLLTSACSDKSANDYLSQAVNHLEQNNQQAAIIELKNAIRLEPSLAQARFLLAKAYLSQNNYLGAEKELERALEFGYPAEQVIPLLSKSYQKTGADNALTQLELSSLGLNANQAAEAYFYKVQAFINLAQQEKAKSLINKITALPTDSPFKSLALVYRLLINEQLDAANIALEQLLTKHPLQAEALKLKARLLIKTNNLTEAINIYRTYVSAYPEDTESTFIFARLLTDNNQTTEAEPIVDNLLTINSHNPLLQQLKAIARFNAKDYQQALAFSESALVKAPDDMALRLVAGVSAFYQQSPEQAHQHLSLIASSLPASHPALRLLAASQIQLGLSLEANETVSQFDQITAQDTALLSNLGLALVDSGEIAKAKQILAKTPEQVQNSAELARLGLLKISLNDVSGILNLEQALATVDNQEQKKPINKVLATAYLNTAQFDKALALAKRWKSEDNTRTDGFLLAGLSYAKSKQFAQAQTEFENALTLSPNNPQIKMSLIELAVSLKKLSTEQELAQLTELINQHNDFIPALSRAFVLSQQLGSSDAIIAKTQQALTTSPENNRLTQALAKMYYSNNNYQATLDTLSPLALNKKTPSSHWQLMAKSYLQLGLYPKALEHYQHWLSIAPSNRLAVIGNIVLLESQGQYQQALQAFQQYAQQQNQQKLATNMQILHTHLLLLNQNFDQAKTSYQQLPEQAKTQPIGASLLGQLQLHEKNYQAALPNLKKAYTAKASPRNANLVYRCLNASSQSKKAYQFLLMHTQKHPNDQTNIMELAGLQLTFDTNAAIGNYQKAIAINENNFIAHNNVAYLYMQQQQFALAKKHGVKALELQPENRDVLDTLGQISLLTGEKEVALQYLSKAVKNKQANEEINEQIWLNYIEALYLNGKVSQANNRLTDLKLTQAENIQKAQALQKKYN